MVKHKIHTKKLFIIDYLRKYLVENIRFNNLDNIYNFHYEGPYSITRHPIYTGLLGMLLVTTLIFGFGYSFIILIYVLIGFKVKINNEEKLLIETFGEGYKDFQKRTPQLFFKFNFLKRS
jgi:hypothetical protein